MVNIVLHNLIFININNYGALIYLPLKIYKFFCGPRRKNIHNPVKYTYT